MTCLYCNAETSNGLALCESCRMAASVYLEFVPVYFRNLARWRPGKAGARPVPGSRIPKGVIPATGDPVERALDEAGAEIAGWARCLSDDRGIDLPPSDDEAPMVVALCRLLNENMTSIATLEWAGEFVQQMAHHEATLRRLTERVAPGWYAGGCRQLAGVDDDGVIFHCDYPTHVVPGLTWVTCGRCGATTYARDHLDVILNEARGWVGRPKAVAEAVVALVDTEQSVTRLYERIKKWEQRGKVIGVRRTDSDGDETGAKCYRFGDVLDLLRREGETRLGDVQAAAS